tara:strand:- start:83 stop:265 length:183 start_codon:yes stop_codon:yes gene_type:complete
MKSYIAKNGYRVEEFKTLSNAIERCLRWDAWYGGDRVITLLAEDESGELWALDPFTGEML